MPLHDVNKARRQKIQRDRASPCVWFFGFLVLISIWSIYMDFGVFQLQSSHSLIFNNNDNNIKSGTTIQETEDTRIGAKNSTKATKIEKIISSFPDIQDLNIAFIGDSLTRYMYLSLVFYITHDTWATDEDHIMERLLPKDEKGLGTHDQWNIFLNHTNFLLRPFEQCDCYRIWNYTFNWSRHCENRYYTHPTKNVHVTYITKMSDYDAHGHWIPPISTNLQPGDINFTRSPFAWRYNWSGIITNHLALLQPKPKYVIINAGLWQSHDLRRGIVLKGIRDALQQADMIGIYKTTTYQKQETDLAIYSMDKHHKHDERACSIIGHCLNLSWTIELNDNTSYIDDRHFKSHVNTRMNLQLLDLIQEIKRNVTGSSSDPTKRRI